MDALMAALVVAVLAGAADRPAWLAAKLGDRFGTGAVLAAATLSLALAAALAVTAGVLVAPLLTPEARRLFLAVALVLQGGGSLGRLKAPDALAGWRLGALPTSALGLFILVFGDGVQFVVAAIAAGSPLPWAAVAGATLGGLAARAPAAILGEAAWLRLPLATIRRGGGALLLLAGLWLGLGALRLV